MRHITKTPLKNMELLESVKEKIKREVSEIEKREDLTKEEKVDKICIIFGTFCAAVAVQPIPFADIFILSPIQAYMGKKIADIHGYDISEHGATQVFKEIAGTIGLGLLSQQLAIGAYKTFIPFLGAITTIPLVFGLTYGMGKVMNHYVKSRIKGHKISADELKKVFNEEMKFGKVIGKKNRNEISAKSKKLENDNVEIKKAEEDVNVELEDTYKSLERTAKKSKKLKEKIEKHLKLDKQISDTTILENSQTIPKKDENKNYTIEDKRQIHKNAYKPWTSDDDEKLKKLFLNGKTINQLSEIFGRNIGGIESRLEKHKLYERKT